MNENVAFSLNIETYKCEHSQFCDPHHKQIICGDLRIIDNSKLRMLMTKCPIYNEPRTLNFNKAFDNINSTINNYIQDSSKNTKLSMESFSKWKKKALKKVKMKIHHLEPNMKQHQAKPNLCA